MGGRFYQVGQRGEKAGDYGCYGKVWLHYGLVWYGVVTGVVWLHYGLVWCGVVWLVTI